MHPLIEINVVMLLFQSRGAYIFGQDLELTMQESSALLQQIPKTLPEFKVWTQSQFMCENAI